MESYYVGDEAYTISQKGCQLSMMEIKVTHALEKSARVLHIWVGFRVAHVKAQFSACWQIVTHMLPHLEAQVTVI